MTARRKAIWRAAQQSGWHQPQPSRPLPVAALRTTRNPIGAHHVRVSSRAGAPTSPPPRLPPCSWPASPASPRCSRRSASSTSTAAQQDALRDALTWSAVLAGLLIGGDATLRTARNVADAKTDAAGYGGRPDATAPDAGLDDPEADLEEDHVPSPTTRSSTPRASSSGSRPADRRRPRLLVGSDAMNTAAAGIALIKEFEGFPFGGRPYRDPVGRLDDRLRPHRRRRPAQPAPDRAPGVELLEHDLDGATCRAVEALPIAQALNDNQFDAPCRSSTTSAPGAIAADTGIGRALRDQQWQRAADEMLRWNRAGGQRARRADAPAQGRAGAVPAAVTRTRSPR